MKSQNYSIGLDIGVTSVGYSVTDENNRIIKFNKKNMLGVRLFDEGKTAQERRGFRSVRRRIDRKRNRIKYLRSFLQDEVKKVDADFFNRLDSSFLEDGKKNILFKNLDINEKKYHEDFPSIYHLRKYLMNSEKKEDIRLVYLALAHIIKNRGHFLFEGEIAESGGQLTDSILEMEEGLEELFEEGSYIINQEQVKDILLNKKIIRKEKEKQLAKVFKSNSKKINNAIKQIIKAILGYKFNLKLIFNLDEEFEKELTDLSFSKEIEQDKIDAVLNDNYFLFEKMQKLYNSFLLTSILGNKHTFSEAMIDKYEEHKKDLKILKIYYKENLPNKYDEMFKTKDKGYGGYINNTAKISHKDLMRVIEKSLENMNEENKDYKYIKKRIDEEDFLSKLRTKDNASIPNQLHKIEIKKILEKQGKHYDCLKLNKGKILKVFSFRIPYYAGPLVQESPWSWIVKNNEKIIYPWNFDEIVDKDKTAEAFIERMRNSCTYLRGENVIPKKSLLYSEFEVLNELNKVSINNQKIGISLKKEIFEDIFKKRKEVKKNNVVEWLIRNKGMRSPEITGMQKEDKFATSLGSYIDFLKIFKSSKYIEDNKPMIEKIIYYLTVYNDKEIIEKRVKKEFGSYIKEEEFSRILKLNYSGWSRLSNRLLDGITGESKETVIEIMRRTTDNFMQIITKEAYGIKKEIEKINIKENKEKISYDTVKDIPTSPANKKGIWQSLKIIEEIIRIMGESPENIFVEMARGEDKKNRTSSRKSKLEKMYKNIIDEIALEAWKSKSNEKEPFFKNDRIFLYFIQEGKCMYSRERLDIEKLEQYDIDHILPQAFIKDDSIENRVLVLKKENMRKSDGAISDYVQKKMIGFWSYLHEKGQISSKKFYNLMRKNISDQDLSIFINRQLVETRQISKHVVTLLANRFEDSTKIVPVKAGLVSQFRKANGLYKIREINDFHHAHDAYITTFVGSYLLKRYKNWGEVSYFKKQINLLNNYRDFYINNPYAKNSYVVKKMGNNLVDFNTGEIIWHGDESLKYLRKVLNYKDVLISKKKEENMGAFYDQTIYAHDYVKAKIRVKKDLPAEVYGGYSSEKIAYNSIIQYPYKNSIKKDLVSIPVQVAYKIRDGKISLVDYLRKKYGQEVEILREKIMKYQEYVEEGCLFYIISENEVCNAKELILPGWCNKFLYEMEVNFKHMKITDEEKNDEFIKLYDAITDKINTYYKFRRTENVIKKLEDFRNVFLALDIDDKKKSILEILKITSVGSERCNLKKYNSNMSEGLGRLSSHSFILDNMTFIDKSVTGLFETRRKL